jgi:amino acid transporter
MASLYPSAGTAYVYVGRGINPHLGFLAGWAMLLVYLANPLFSVMYATLSIRQVAPRIPFWLAAAILVCAVTLLNLRGVRSTARTNQLLTGFMFIVLLAYVVLSIRYVVMEQGIGGLFSMRPFYSPNSWSIGAIARGTSFAALTYLGFDAVTTLAEEVRGARRTVSLATVSVTVFTGTFGGLLVYLSQLAWPNYNNYANVDTAFIEVTGRVGGLVLLRSSAGMLIVANFACALATQAAAARLLYGMGRDNVIPQRFFGYLAPTTHSPTRAVLFSGGLAYVGVLTMSYEYTAKLMNCGAFLVFIGVNLAVFWQFWIRCPLSNRRGFLNDCAMPITAVLFCLAILIGLGNKALISGAGWLVLGFVLLGYHTSFFRRAPVLPT